MIYTLTLNPALDYNMILSTFEPHRVNRSQSEYILAGGKGLMVSQMLKNLSVESTALGLAAGFTGDELIRILKENGIKTNFVRLPKGMTRINVKLWGGLEGEINTAGPEADEKSLQALLEKMNVLTEDDILVLAGTVPASLPSDLYAKIIQQLEHKKARIVVDATGELLKKVIPYHPFLVKPNHHELSEIFETELSRKEECIPYAKKLQEIGARNVLVSLGGEGAVLITEEKEVLIADAVQGQVKNTVGSGDSMVAGFLSRVQDKKKYSLQEAFIYGIAAGSASAFSDTLASEEEVKAIAGQVIVRKMER